MGISYIVTAYNKAAYLEDTLATIAAERRASGGEIVIVDDGSTDAGGEILRRFAAANPQARVVSQANKGVVAATNVGFRHSACTAIRFCDADDLLPPGSSRVLLETLEATGADIAFGRHDTYLARPERLAPVVPQGPGRRLENPLRSALRHNLFSPSSTLLARRAAERILPLPEHFRTGQDYMMGLRACFCASIARVDATLSLGPAQHDEARLSADLTRMYGETARFLADEILAHTDRWPAGDAAYALRRNAGRALLWARRSGRPAGLLLKLQLLKLTARLRDKPRAARDLAWLAAEVYGLR